MYREDFMEKNNSDQYIFQKKSLLILLYLFYINDVKFDSLSMRSFGFSFDPTCNFKVIIKLQNNDMHKYAVHIYNSSSNINYKLMDVQANINIIKVNKLNSEEFFFPNNSLNVYFDSSRFIASGFIENQKISYELKYEKDYEYNNNLFYLLEKVGTKENCNKSANSFILWLLRLFTTKLHTDLVMGAGINCDYGAKDWKCLVDNLNNEFYVNDSSLIGEVQHFVGDELFVSGKVINTGGFDVYKFLNKELYLFKEAKSFNDKDSTLYKCVNYIEKHPRTSVITYNYDTNLEYLLKKRNLRYCTIYDDNSFVDNDSIVDIYHVHGLLPYNCYSNKKFTNSIIFNESEYYYLYNNPYSWNISKQLHDFKYNVCIFIGISLTDPNMKRLLELGANYFKFNFIFMKKEDGYNEKTYKDVTNYFFAYDLITIWVSSYDEIGKWLELI